MTFKGVLSEVVTISVLAIPGPYIAIRNHYRSARWERESRALLADLATRVANAEQNPESHYQPGD